MKRIAALSICLLLLVPAIASAQDSYFFMGPHPVHPSFGQGFCYTPGSHAHNYGIDPNVQYLYRVHNSHYVFVGNVYEFGYQQQAFPYYGHHPLPGELGGSFCYLDGSHYHYFVPPVSYANSFLVHNGYYYYNGMFPPVYYTYRPTFYRTYYTYRYLPTYRNYYTTYRTYTTTYARPASVTYIHNPPPRVTVYTPRTSVVVPRTRVVTTTRTYTTTPARPVYRYNPHRPSSYNTYYRRPVYNAPPVVRRTTTTTYRPGGTTTRVTTTRTWRRR
jgi:hypothetical protein